MRTFLPLALGSLLVVGFGFHTETHAQPTIERSADRPIEVSPSPTPKPARAEPAAQKGKGLKPKKEAPVREARPPGQGLSFKPAPEVVTVTCPASIHHVARLENTAAELRGWKAEPVRPQPVRVELRFSGFESDFWGDNWEGASSIVCTYSTRGEGDYYSQRLSRKIHASGTPYQCKVKPRKSRSVECRLSITPDF